MKILTIATKVISIVAEKGFLQEWIKILHNVSLQNERQSEPKVLTFWAFLKPARSCNFWQKQKDYNMQMFFPLCLLQAAACDGQTYTVNFGSTCAGTQTNPLPLIQG